MRRDVEMMERHIEQLCEQYGIELAGGLLGTGARDPLARGPAGNRDPPIKGQVSYFIALHEIGHLVGRGRSAPRLESEANAWLWALEHCAVEPTVATRRSIVRRLEGYLAWAQNRQYRRVPPRIPERDHAFWALLTLADEEQAA